MSVTIPGPISDLIASRDWKDTLGELSQQIVEKQLSTHAQATREASERARPHNSLFEQTATKIVASIAGPEDLAALAALPTEVAKKAVWQSESLPTLPFAC